MYSEGAVAPTKETGGANRIRRRGLGRVGGVGGVGGVEWCYGVGWGWCVGWGWFGCEEEEETAHFLFSLVLVLLFLCWVLAYESDFFLLESQ